MRSFMTIAYSMARPSTWRTGSLGLTLLLLLSDSVLTLLFYAAINPLASVAWLGISMSRDSWLTFSGVVILSRIVAGQPLLFLLLAYRTRQRLEGFSVWLTAILAYISSVLAFLVVCVLFALFKPEGSLPDRLVRGSASFVDVMSKHSIENPMVLFAFTMLSAWIVRWWVGRQRRSTS